MTRLPWGRLIWWSISHPRDGVALARAGWRLRATRWWSRPPFLPLPGRRYLRFRLTTAFGEDPRPRVADLVDVAHWSLRQPRHG